MADFEEKDSCPTATELEEEVRKSHEDLTRALEEMRIRGSEKLLVDFPMREPERPPIVVEHIPPPKESFFKRVALKFENMTLVQRYSSWKKYNDRQKELLKEAREWHKRYMDMCKKENAAGNAVAPNSSGTLTTGLSDRLSPILEEEEGELESEP